MRIKIKGLKIRNFRCIGELDLDFTDPDGNPLDLVVLAGPNGCGKTSVLEAIKILLDWDVIVDAKDRNLVRLSDVSQGAEKYQLIFVMDCAEDFAEFRIEGPHYHFHASRPPYNQMGGKGKWSEYRNRIPEMPFEYFSSRRRQKLVPSLPVSDERKDKEAAPEEIDRLFSLQRRCIDQWVHSSLNRHDPASDPKVRAIIDPLEKAWEIFYPGAESQFIVRSVNKDNPEEGVNLYLRRKDGTEIPVNDLSSGEIEVLTMAGWFVMEDYKGGIVLIDEPELHMHVQWHRAIMRALRVLLPKTQIIVATHSWDILKSVMSYERFTLLREGDPRTAVDSKAVIR